MPPAYCPGRNCGLRDDQPVRNAVIGKKKKKKKEKKKNNVRQLQVINL
jgi:hypothetical protein